MGATIPYFRCCCFCIRICFCFCTVSLTNGNALKTTSDNADPKLHAFWNKREKNRKIVYQNYHVLKRNKKHRETCQSFSRSIFTCLEVNTNRENSPGHRDSRRTQALLEVWNDLRCREYPDNRTCGASRTLRSLRLPRERCCRDDVERSTGGRTNANSTPTCGSCLKKFAALEEQPVNWSLHKDH